MNVARARYLECALALTGTPYVWGGRTKKGIDCSGLVVRALYDASLGGLNVLHWWSDRLWTELEPTDKPQPGDLAFYGGSRPDDVSHVEIVLVPPGGQEMPEGLPLGARGGDSKCTTPEIALAKHPPAIVRATSEGVRYRRDFRGFRSMRRFLADG